MVERLEASGTDVSAIPRGLDYREGGKCVLCSTCDSYYCRLDAKMDAEVACVRPAVASGKVTLLTKAECLTIVTSPDGRRASGVRVRHNGTDTVVYSDNVILSAGIAETPLILRRSRTTAAPEGLGNGTGCLGRYMCGHTSTFVLPVVSVKPIPWVHTKTFAINKFCRPSSTRPYPLGVIQMGGMPTEDYDGLPALVRPMARWLMARSVVAICMTEEPSKRDSGFLFHDDSLLPKWSPPLVCRNTHARLCKEAKRAFRGAGYSIVFSPLGAQIGWHSVGTARMGTDPGTSVVDSECRVHGMENLYVVDSSSLPSPGAVNTGLTIMALALRVADHIAGRRKERAKVRPGLMRTGAAEF